MVCIGPVWSWLESPENPKANQKKKHILTLAVSLPEGVDFPSKKLSTPPTTSFQLHHHHHHPKSYIILHIPADPFLNIALSSSLTALGVKMLCF
jgi:hypothetical protein